MSWIARVLLCLSVVSGMVTASLAEALAENVCGADTPCKVEGGEYRVRFPSDWDGETPIGAIFFVHGWRGSARAEMRSKGWARMADELNVAFVAPEGNGTWGYPGSPTQTRDEFAYFENVVKDLTTRFAVRADRLLASGFSMGGSMVWNLACYRSHLFAGFAPVAGAFWDPIPDRCPSPTPILFHVHGTSDRTVPIHGRPIGSIWSQSDVAQSLAVWQKEEHLPTVFPTVAPAEGIACQRQETDSALLEVCLHDGGHSVRGEWIRRAWNELSRRKGW
ncbi:polyhydroxybutyrate depolymerase [Rhizobiales bacterium]|uniref:alpha/beta hydrolase family esterase n=1 Tax=Hongsoonwoonella zoysiae TaxID=2821844 RepID=UPI001561840C|nr:polyhydroxybutyrate depolymerase [Hongsoonwoonella zoysiae]NRG16326.1 polyhydroxybutyrate depolymerase [Hongsoonwoonella zoysiae]